MGVGGGRKRFVFLDRDAPITMKKGGRGEEAPTSVRRWGRGEGSVAAVEQVSFKSLPPFSVGEEVLTVFFSASQETARRRGGGGGDAWDYENGGHRCGASLFFKARNFFSVVCFDSEKISLKGASTLRRLSGTKVVLLLYIDGRIFSF